MGLFSRFRKSAERSESKASLPANLLVYAIGDIHGRDDLFAELVERIEIDRRARPHDRCNLILLGDLVDRGPDSDKVIERALALGSCFDQVHHLIGNHEECMLAALSGDVRALRYFVRIGGEATVRSYLRNDSLYDVASFEELAELFPSLVPQSHVDFLGRGEDWVVYGDFMFVHAGVRDDVPLDRQKTSDLRWIRDEFLQSRAERPMMIVHGHTISVDIEQRPNRIGIDTGAYASGKLTAIGLSGDERWFLQTGANT